jgi:hypothetical protein
MDDALIVLAAAAGALHPIQPEWNPADPVAAWLEIGRSNIWIGGAYDPPFTCRSFAECKTADELRARFEHGIWSLGQAFYIGTLCFIQQIDGADEWLVIKENVTFESACCGRMIAFGRFDDFLSRIQAATLEQCARLDY